MTLVTGSEVVRVDELFFDDSTKKGGMLQKIFDKAKGEIVRNTTAAVEEILGLANGLNHNRKVLPTF